MAIERNPDWTSEDTDAQFETLAAATALSLASPTRTAEQIFKDSAPDAAQQIVNLSLNAENERVRLDASKYVVDRVMGRVAERGLTGSDENAAPWDGVYGTTVIREPAAAERQAGRQVTRSVLQPHPNANAPSTPKED
jgi:hypothetical protein